MPYQTLQLDYADGAATLTLNRPERRNALSPAMIEEIGAALGEAESSSAGVLILTGAGEAFCSGMDLDALKALTSRSPEESLADSRRVAELFRKLYQFPKPVIAAVNGAAVAGGCGLATLPDFTLAVPQAQFGYPEARIGFLPAIVSLFLIRQIGEKAARGLLLSARLIGAEEAYRIGLITEIVPRESLLTKARELAAQLLACSPTSLQYTKRLLRDFSSAAIERELELAIQANAAIRSTQDFREGLSAFLEKRKPHWTSPERGGGH